MMPEASRMLLSGWWDTAALRVLRVLMFAVAQVDAVGGVQVTAQGERTGSLQHSQRIFVHLTDVLEQVDMELDPERLGDRRHVFDVGREGRSGVSGDLERSERVIIDELLLGRDDVRAVPGRRTSQTRTASSSR